MHGNVWEWVKDVWHDNYKGAPIDGSAWTDSEDEYSYSNRVNRGGCWNDNPWNLPSAVRNRNLPVFRSNLLGFRVCPDTRVGV
jgi:formylglycine-generating enzyme required for sulfatase activity